MAVRSVLFAGAAVLATAFAPVAFAEEAQVSQTDGERWNEGVGYYEAGDMTNALRVLRPLILTKTHGSRAAAVVAAIEYSRGDLEEAAAAAQIALRAKPDDENANRNFTIAVDRLPEKRREAKIAAILKAAEGKDPGQMLGGGVYEARSLMKEAGGYLTNRAERAVALSDSLSARAEKLADVWLPVREFICQNVTNEEQAATIVQQTEEAEQRTRKAAKEFGDMNAEAYGSMSAAEHDFYRFYKLTAMPPAAIAEDLTAESNAWLDVEEFNGRVWQKEALDWTRIFRAKFPAWARAYEQQAQADTNKPPFTAEAQAKISELSTELEKVQIECTEKSLPPKQQEALALIEKIRELLPKDGNGGGQQQNQNQQQNQDKQNQDKQNQQQQQQDQQQQPDQQQDQQSGEDQKNDGDNEEQPEDGEEDEQNEEPSEEEKELDAVLKKAQERNDEHEADKKARALKTPLPPNEKDW